MPKKRGILTFLDGLIIFRVSTTLKTQANQSILKLCTWLLLRHRDINSTISPRLLYSQSYLFMYIYYVTNNIVIGLCVPSVKYYDTLSILWYFSFTFQQVFCARPLLVSGKILFQNSNCGCIDACAGVAIYLIKSDSKLKFYYQH